MITGQKGWGGGGVGWPVPPEYGSGGRGGGTKEKENKRFATRKGISKLSEELSLGYIAEMKYLVANAPLFYFLFHRLVFKRVHFTWGCMRVNVRWSGGLFVLELNCCA
jgi:hypothetical protein